MREIAATPLRRLIILALNGGRRYNRENDHHSDYLSDHWRTDEASRERAENDDRWNDGRDPRLANRHPHGSDEDTGRTTRSVRARSRHDDQEDRRTLPTDD